VAVAFSLAIHAELAVVVGEDVGLGAEIVLGKNAPHSADVLPHHVFATNLERLREMVQLLVLRCFFQVLGLCLACPLHVPFRAVRSYDAEPCCLERVDHRVVDVSSFRDFEAQHHVVCFKVVLSGHLHFLKLSQLWFECPVRCQ